MFCSFIKSAYENDKIFAFKMYWRLRQNSQNTYLHYTLNISLKFRFRKNRELRYTVLPIIIHIYYTTDVKLPSSRTEKLLTYVYEFAESLDNFMNLDKHHVRLALARVQPTWTRSRVSGQDGFSRAHYDSRIIQKIWYYNIPTANMTVTELGETDTA